MKNLQQAVYEDDNGREFPAEKVDYLAPYTYIADGFYRWTCGGCGEEHSDRWWSVSGRVVECRKGSGTLSDVGTGGGCGKMNLLVRTNCTEISTALAGMWRQPEIIAENERLKGVTQWNEEQLGKIKAEVINTVTFALTEAQGKLLKS